MKKKIISPAKSFQGWKIDKWLIGNWTTIKEILKVGVPCAIGWFATGNPYLTSLITLLGKLLVDAGEYWIKEKTE